MLGQVLHRRYRLDRELGRGGLATAYQARDLVRGRDVALKLVPTADEHGTLLREFQLLRGLLHPNLLEVDDLGRHGDRAYYVAELIDGASLSQWARTRSWSELREPLGQALGALAFLHDLGIRHGDIKPDNILVDGSGRATLLDLSCAESLTPLRGVPALGTPGYRAPELERGERDARSDLYSLGVTLRELASGCSDVPTELDALIEHLTLANPGERPTSVAEVLDALRIDVDLERTPLTHAGRFVGRERELEHANELFDALAAGRAGPRIVVLHGPAGIGRTRLLQQIKWRAQARFPVVEGFAESEDAVDGMLRRLAEDPRLAPGLAGLIGAQRLLAGSEPVVAVLDDAESLTAGQRQRLDQIVRAAQPNDRALWIFVDASAPAKSDTVVGMHLEPLTDDAVRAWLGTTVPEPLLTRVVRGSGGVPADAIAHVVHGGDEELSGTRARALSEMPAEERRLLCRVALGDETKSTDGEQPGVGWDRLAHAGWVRWDGARYKLIRSADAKKILGALGDEMVMQVRTEAAEHLRERLDGAGGEPATRAHLGGRLAFHLAGLGRVDELVELLEEEELARWHDSSAFLPAVRLLARDARDAHVLDLCADVLSRSGEPELALGAVTRALRERPPSAARGRLRVRAADILVRHNRDAEALRYLERARRTMEPDDRARIDDRVATALVKLGNHDRGLKVAEEALAHSDLPARLEPSLRVTAGVAASYVARDDLARKHLERVGAAEGDAFLRFRAESALALIEHRDGNAELALTHYSKALSLAETGDLTDQLPVALLNLGVAAHQAGDLGRALDAYERGLSAATAVAAKTTVTTLLFDLARLCIDLGLLDRAERYVGRGAGDVDGQRMPFMAAAFESLRGEIALHAGAPGRALAHLERAITQFQAQGAAREVLESRIGLARALCLSGKPSAGRELLDDVARAIATAPDLTARLEQARGEAAAHGGDSATAIRLLERARQDAVPTGQRLLCAEIEASLADLHEEAGARLLAKRYRTAAKEKLERAAVALPGPIRERFASSSFRARVSSAIGEEAPVDDRRLAHLMSINRRLNASLEVEDVLRHAMDAAIELTGAERGFLILRKGDRYKVRVARNLDQEQVGRPQMKFSRSIAERAIESGEPIITFDAETDPRFASQRSVHAMQLKSVACAPLRFGDEIRGALYVDNRFRRGGFRQGDVELLLAVADQVAIALRNAQLHESLALRTAELEAERSRIRELLARREVEIDRLQSVLEARGTEIATRHDYADIVGRSDAIRSVLAVMDRVTESDVSVLVQGESGTGKELIARALHANGPRASGPFVALNCAALPDTLIEAELFGYRRGAFTGAVTDRDGLFVRARGGTVFLDELGEMSQAMQARLLRVLQEREVSPLGGTEPVSIDVRVICATNRDLEEDVRESKFREDLYYRVAVVVLRIPPLRDRPEDIPAIAQHLLARVAEEGVDRRELGADALSALLTHDYPGNIRELDNILRRAAVLCTSDAIHATDLGLPLSAPLPARDAGRRGFRPTDAARMTSALRDSGWNVADAARTLGMPRATFYRRMKRYGIGRP